MSDENNGTHAHATDDGRAHAYDVIVVGAGIGGLYAAHRFAKQGLSVLGLEGASGVGGVWHHNRYPGARVDIDSIDYCYHFSPEVAKAWRWTERYASQPELLEYLNFVADTHGLRRHFQFETWMTGAQWRSDSSTYEVTTSTGQRYIARFLVMATGNLSRARKPPFEGLDRFRGEWVQTSHWPERDVPLDGRRVGVIGTGSSGVQVIPEVAKVAEHLTVFQRSPHYVVPARNAPIPVEQREEYAATVMDDGPLLLTNSNGTRLRRGDTPAAGYNAEEQIAALEKQWEFGGQAMMAVFSDQNTEQTANDIASAFVRDKIRSLVEDPDLAEKLCPSYPMGTRRLVIDTGYYETYNRENVTLLDVREDPIVEITETGIRTQSGRVELDLIVFALGFDAFTGAIDSANIRNEEGRTPTDHWTRGPRTMLGIMTAGFPNLFMPTGAGSPATLANLFLSNEFCMDWIADAIAHLDANGLRSIEPSEEAEDAWTRHVTEVAGPLLRLKFDNYMVQVNDDGSRVFVPYAGGLHTYVQKATAVADSGYEGFVLR